MEKNQGRTGPGSATTNFHPVYGEVVKDAFQGTPFQVIGGCAGSAVNYLLDRPSERGLVSQECRVLEDPGFH